MQILGKNSILSPTVRGNIFRQFILTRPSKKLCLSIANSWGFFAKWILFLFLPFVCMLQDNDKNTYAHLYILIVWWCMYNFLVVHREAADPKSLSCQTKRGPNSAGSIHKEFFMRWVTNLDEKDHEIVWQYARHLFFCSWA